MTHRIGKKLYNLKYILSVEKRERMFCIFDKEFRWELKIDYFSPHMEDDHYPIYNGKTTTFVNFPKKVMTQHDTYRMTEHECEKHMKKLKWVGHEGFVNATLKKEELEFKKSFRKN